ncbi:oxidoreductase [Natranaeroarchaeum sulfidigenes]|nr:oxidoreductase [Natranaeroarchaeum sulfidigenes]
MSAADQWTIENMPNQSGRRIVITGANSGLGFEATKAFARKGGEVVMACRDRGRGERARDEILTEVPDADLVVERCDLADLDSIEAFADRLQEAYNELDVLCNNAGVMAIPYRETADGFERQFGVNHLGHFALTEQLLDLLAAPDAESRVVTHASEIHERGEIDPERLVSRIAGEDAKHSYDKWDAYGRSKLANVLFAYELNRRLDDAGMNVTSLTCHPGYADTNLQRRGPKLSGSAIRERLASLANRLFAQPSERGSLPLLYAATAADIEGGEYIGPGGLLNMRGYPERQRSSEASYDRELARKLWRISVELTGVSYEFDSHTTSA